MKQFKRIYIEITNICNLSCSFCPPLKRKAAYMDCDKFEHIVKEIAPYTDYVYLHVKGEPLLHKDLEAILKICSQYKLHANLTTNGTLIPHQQNLLLHSPSLRQVNISLHSFEEDPTNYGQLESYIHPILDFAKRMSTETKGIVALRLWNYEKQDTVMEKNNTFVITLMESVFKTKIDCSQICRGIKLMDRVYLNRDYKFEWPNMDRPVLSTQGFCYGLSTQAAILVDGTVTPCCLDNDGDISLGNIFQTSFQSIINNQRSRQIIQGFKDGQVKEELCKRCGYRHRFT